MGQIQAPKIEILCVTTFLAHEPSDWPKKSSKWGRARDLAEIWPSVKLMMSQPGGMGQELSAKCPSLRRLCALTQVRQRGAAQYACTRVPQGAVEPQRLPDAPPSQRCAPRHTVAFRLP